MTTKVSLGGLNHRSTQMLRKEIEKTANGNIETMEEYVRLIRLVRQSFLKKHNKTPIHTKERS